MNLARPVKATPLNPATPVKAAPWNTASPVKVAVSNRAVPIIDRPVAGSATRVRIRFSKSPTMVVPRRSRSAPGVRDARYAARSAGSA